MTRGAPLARRSRLKGTPRPGWTAVKAMVLVRDKWRCRVCHDWAADVHHVQKRSTGGKRRREYLDSPENLIALCRACHDRTDASYDSGRRLVIEALGGQAFRWMRLYAVDKWHEATVIEQGEIRTEGGYAGSRQGHATDR